MSVNRRGWRERRQRGGATCKHACRARSIYMLLHLTGTQMAKPDGKAGERAIAMAEGSCF
jgi:hypothetical protein